MLTDPQIRNLKAPEAGQKIHWDEIKGFGVRVSAGGTKSFVVVHGPETKRTWATLGRYPTLSLAEARTKAKQLLAAVTLGQHQSRTLAFDDAVERFIAHCRTRNRIRTVHEYGRLLRHFPFAKRELTTLTRREIVARTERLPPSEGAHALTAIKVFFSWCVNAGYLSHNPVAGVSAQVRAKPRERVLDAAELAAILTRAMTLDTNFARIVRLCIYTGQRRGEIARMEWNWIDPAERTITIPAEVSKNGRQHTFPFGAHSDRLYAELPKIAAALFASRTKEGATFNGWSKAKRAFDGGLDVKPYTLHDLRRTFASVQASLGTPPHVVEKILNHVSGTISGVAAVYNKYTYLQEMRDAMRRYDEYLERLTSPDAANTLSRAHG